MRAIRILLAIITTIAFLYGISCSVDARKARKHNPDKIKIEITDMESKNDDKNYYIYSDFSIKNNTSKTLVYLKITTYIYDSNGKSIGSIESTFGSGNNLNLEKKEQTIQETYLSEKISNSMSPLFSTLYHNNNIEDFSMEHIVISARWEDGYYYNRLSY